MRHACFALATALLISLTAQAQYTSMYGYSFNNPISASINTMIGMRLNARMTYRTILERHGYTDEQLGQMSTDEMVSILGGSAKANQEAAATPPAATPASRFKPTNRRLLLPSLADSLVQDLEQRAALLEVFEQGLRAYEQEAAADGLVNDIAGASAFFIGTAYYVANDGTEPDENGLTIAARQLQQLFDTPEMRQQPDAEKQRFYELLIGLATWLGLSYQLAAAENDTAQLQMLKGAAKDALKGYLKVDVSKLRITPRGLEITG